MTVIASNDRWRRAAPPPGALGIVAASFLGVCICLIAGFAIALLPWWLVLAVVLLPVVIIGGALWPFPILLLALALLFQAIPGRVVPPIGKFRLDELIMLYLVVVVVMRAVWRRENPLAAAGPFIWPIFYLYVCVVLSAVYVKFFAPNSSLLYELRGFVVWLTVPLLTYVVTGVRQRKALMVFIATVSVLVAIYTMTESFLHIGLLANRVEMLDTSNSDVTRSLAGGTTYLMAFTLLWMINKTAAGTRWFPLLMLMALICAGGLAVSFGRGVWIATAFGFVVATWLNRGLWGMVVSVLLAALMLTILLLGIASVKPRVVEAMVDRALGVSDELRSGGSFYWRHLENGYALAAIDKRPLTGVGLGGQYKNSVSAEGSFENETQYIHNAYVGLMVKMGVQAILVPILMIAIFVAVAYRMRRAISAEDRPLFAAVVAAFFIPVITSYTQPEWIERSGVGAICLLVVSLRLLDRYPSTPPKAS
jgi:O-antigen ligase